MSKLETNQVDPSTGTTLTLGTSGDTIAIPSGVTIANSGTATGFGENMTPAFSAKSASDQSFSSSFTKVTLGTEILDTDNAFASDKFTVPSGKGGRYFVCAQISINCTTDTRRVEGMVYKNGSGLNELKTKLHMNGSSINDGDITFSISGIIDLSASDYLELYGYSQTTAGGSFNFVGGYNTLAGFKIIE